MFNITDFNINLMNLNPVESCQDFDVFFFLKTILLSLIYQPCRLTPTSATCLDHIYVNFLKNFFVGVLHTNFGDHYATLCCIPNWIRRISNVSKY